MTKGISLHIGLNFIDPSHYGGWNGELNACENDARDMESICSSQGFETTLLLREEATRKNVINQITKASTSLKSGDIFCLTFSAHGGQLPDFNSDEKDLLDETWCLYDGQLIDDELKKLWTSFEDSVKILVISDSCNSGDIIKFYDNDIKESLVYKTKNMPSEIIQRSYYKNKNFYDEIMKEISLTDVSNIKASVKLISGSTENGYSYDGPFNSVFTAHLKKIWNCGKYNLNYKQFYRDIKNSIIYSGRNQNPQLKNIGKPNANFDNQIPFEIVPSKKPSREGVSIL